MVASGGVGAGLTNKLLLKTDKLKNPPYYFYSTLILLIVAAGGAGGEWERGNSGSPLGIRGRGGEGESGRNYEFPLAFSL